MGGVIDVGVTTAAQWVAEGTFREKIQEENGVWVGGMKNNAVGISDMSSLETFLEFGIETGEITYDEFPEIKQKVRDMRDAQPDWVWEGVNELKNRILNDEVTVPPAATSEEIQEIRNKYG
ncbi:hypothetical protein AKJ66_04110 [candidate division MSBL1 archaeon SCGC-AAA259E22]|uniref:Uncharacterized protein n=1 Tax=candidate division MSBL1 archaeon SCGC-AAA259E22 TaxID=1698265 RepID=A0A133UE37_9EURY|nr:hypothetical protein AKJ66_04110 [candidate division MSBL1 archaeon SCGC-AAA259E22]